MCYRKVYKVDILPRVVICP